MDWPNLVVVDPKLAAPRGEEYTVAYQEKQQRLQQQGEDGDWKDFANEDDQNDEIPRPTLDTEIADSNIGFKLLQKMGWSKGKGLGREETGIVEPVRAGVEAGVRLGLGKQEEDDKYTNAENIERKKLEIEIQATEDDERRKRREMQAERDQKIREEVTEIKKTFYCEVCQKQYEKAIELEGHLSSYDHHHKKRLAEMRVMQNQRTRGDRQKKEQKAQDKELAKLQQQIRAAQQQQQQQQGAAAPPDAPPLPTGPPPPSPPDQPASRSDSGWQATGGWSSSHPAPPSHSQTPASAIGWVPQPPTFQQAPPLPPALPGHAVAAPPPPPPPPPAPPEAPAAGVGAGQGMSFSLGMGGGLGMKLGGVGRGGLTGKVAGVKRPAVAAAATKPAKAAALAGFGESDSEDEAKL